MNNGVTIEPTLAIEWLLAACAGFSTIMLAVGHVIKIIHAARAPKKAVEARLAELEKAVEDFRTYLSDDKKRLDAYEDGSRVMQRAMLALLSHSIDGNNVEELKTAKAELHKYLIER